jgi:putative nucleotidyltransferase with HDIG domain
LLALALALTANTVMPRPTLALGAVTTLDPWPATPQMTGTTGNPTNYDFAISDGIDRLLVVLVCDYDYGGTSGQTFSATYGGKTLTQAFLQNNNRRQTWIGYLKENDIASRSGDTVTVTVTGTHTQVRAYVASYAGVDQTAPITDAGGVYISGSNNLPIGGPLAVNAGGYAFYGWSAYSGRTRTSDTESYGEDSDVNNVGVNTFNYGVASKPFASSGTTNPSVTWQANNYVSVSFVTLNPDSAYPLPTTTSISPTSKSLGDASFTLTVNGTNFLNSVSVVRLDGADRSTTFVSTTQLTATIPAGDLATAGNKSITVFTPAPGGGTSNAQTLVVVKATPVITWANPADIVYGTALSSTQLCATASVPGTFAYAPGVGAVLSAGDAQSLHVDFTPTDTGTYNATSADVSINVKKAALTITAKNGNKTYGDLLAFSGTEFTADGLVNGGSVNSVTLTSAGAGTDATVAGGPYSIVPSAATGMGLGNYNISYVNGSLTVNRRALTITASNLNKTYGDAVAFAGIEFTVDGLVNGDTIDGVTLTSVGAARDATPGGSPYTVLPSAAFGWGLGNYNITYVNGSLVVNPASVSVSLSSSVDKSTQGRSVTFTATVAGTGVTGTVTFLDGETVLGSTILSDGTATYSTEGLSAGSHSISAVYSGDANYVGTTSSAIDLAIDPAVSAAGFNRALIGWIVAGAALALFFLMVIIVRRRKRASRTSTISRAMGVVFNDTVSTKVALSTVEEVSTYPIQLERELENSIKRVEKSMHGAIQAICRTVESKDSYVAAHQKRVSQFACTIAKEMGLSTWQIDGIRVAGLLHDIGKVTVPMEILSKPGKLSKIEMSMIKDHPKVAFDILKNVEFDWPVARMVVQHHERMDGSGYPDGIKGEEILLEARILAVADVVEAMCTHRPYRPARGVDEALAELERGEGTLYDPDVVRACKKVLNERGFKVEFSETPA